MRVCEKHGTEKVLLGVKWRCRECQREAVRRWREQNPEKVREEKRRYYEQNPEKVREAVRRWQKQNPEKAREAVRRYREQNPEKARERRRRWGERNPEKKREMDLVDLERNKEKHLAHKAASKIPMASECFLCGVPKGDAILHRHHPDYGRPDYIFTLCAKCHGYITRLERAKKEALCG